MRQYLQYVYLLLAVAGGGLTFYFVMQGMMQHDGKFDVAEFIRSTWTDNPYARSLTFDFWTGAVAGTMFIMFEGMRLKMKRWWIFVVLVVGIGFAFGFPLFLFVRERVLVHNSSVKNE
jgi:hypothetical protein